MRPFSIFIAICAAVVISGCAPHTFVVTKEGRSFYLGRDSRSIHKMLCDSGDLKRILSEVQMPDYIKNDLYTYNCTEQHSEQKVISSYLLLTPDEQKALKSAFIRYDYTVNYVAC